MNEKTKAPTGSSLTRLLRPVSAHTAIALVFEVIGAAASVLPFIALTQIAHELVDAYQHGVAPNTDATWDGVFLLLIGIGIQLGFTSLALLITHFADVRLQAHLRLTLADKMGRLPLGWFDNNSSGRVRHLIANDVDALHQLVAHSVVETVSAVITPLVGLIYCFYLDWRLGPIALVPILAYFVTYSLLTIKCERDMMNQIAAGLAVISAAIVDYVNGVSVLKIFNQTGTGFSRFKEASEAFTKRFRELVNPAMRAQSIAVSFMLLPTSALITLGFGVWFVQEGWTTPINLLVVTIIAMTIPSTVYTVAISNTAMKDAVAAAGRITDLLDEPELPEPEPATAQVPTRKDVEFDHVIFSYREGKDVINDVSFTLPAGSITALVGPSGAGKSTLGTLLPRFRDVTGGAIRIGGVDLRNMTTDTLYHTVGIVLQDVQMLKISVRDNIRLACPAATDEQVIDAAKVARIHSRIMEFEDGYDTIVGVDALLSGGEAQRISIARTLLSNTPILVLDEATSATDPESEAEIQQALSRLVAGRTVLVIAHRLSTIAQVDNIIVLDHGSIVESGTHDELRAQGGMYAHMWDTLHSAESDTLLAQDTSTPHAATTMQHTTQEAQA